MKNTSLSFRLLMLTSLILVAFFVLISIVLEKGFRESAEQALKQRLKIQVYALLSVAELTPPDTLLMPDNLSEPRFSHPGSGLYASVWLPSGELIWRSPSAIGKPLRLLPHLTPGVMVFQQDASGVFTLYYPVIWEAESGHEKVYVFSVSENSDYVVRQVAGFRKTLWTWLAVIGLLLIIIQFMVLRWGLKPLRTIGKELEAIEQGKKSRLEEGYPAELKGLAENLNDLILSERRHLDRYRNTLADLAHSLKTPLAIVRGTLETRRIPAEIEQTLQTEISRMNDIVEYHLQRAAAKGQKKKRGFIDAGQLIKKITASLEKVYAEKNIKIDVVIGTDDKLHCEAGDFYEIVGNLLDNACKWCRCRVKASLSDTQEVPYSVALIIEDDGPGIATENLHQILQRGIREDESSHGHGIGLAVVREITGLLNGRLIGGRSELLGGMKWTVFLP